MMNLKFDLQRFAGALEPQTTKSWYDGTNWSTTFKNLTASSIKAYYDGSTHYIVETADADTSIATNFTGTVMSATFTVSADKTTITPAGNSALIGLGGTTNGVTASTGSGKITFNGGKITTMSGTGTVTVTGDVGFSNASGTVSGATTGIFTLSSFTGTVTGGADGIIESFDSGTVKASSNNTATNTIVGATFAGAVTVTKVANNEYYTATLNGMAQVVSLANTKGAFNVTGSNGADTFNGVGAKFADSISAGAGKDTISVADAAKTVYIDGGAADDSIKSGTQLGNNSTILGGDGKDIINLSGITTATTDVLVRGDAGDDFINAAATNAANFTNSTVLGGAGKDTLIANNASVVLTGGADADAFDITTQGYEANISDYKFGEDVLLVSGQDVVGTATNWVEQNNNDTLSSDGTTGVIKNGAVSAATITSSNGFFAVTLQDEDKNKVALGWVGESATNINASSMTTPVVLTGTTNTEADLLIGGAKADTIYAGTGDSIYGGAGKDSLNMAASTYGVYVGIATDSGADTVTGFTTGFDIDSADAVYMVNGTSADFGASVNGTDLVLKDGSAAMTLASGTGVTAGAAGAYELLVSGKKVAVAANKGEIKTDDLAYADYWFGTYNKDDKTGSAANFSTATDAVNINLGDTDHVRYIYTVTGGSGNTTLMGGANAESLVAASGSTTSLYGGAGKDTLVSSGDSKTEFFFMNGAGNDEIQNFTTGTDTDTSDVLNFYGSALGSISRTGDGVVKIKTSDGSTLTVNQKTGSADEKLQWVSGAAKGVAKIANTSGSSLSYETDVTNYIGSSKKDTITVGAGDGADVNIWLDGSQGVNYSDIDVVDASGRAGNTTIAGSAIAETITGGSGNASVWGGVGQVADVLRSTSGSTTMFFYGLGNGSDNISGSANDTVNLFDIKLSDIASANIQNSQVILTTSTNDTVTVSGAQTFQLADGSRWTANYSNNQWEAAQ